MILYMHRGRVKTMTIGRAFCHYEEKWKSEKCFSHTVIRNGTSGKLETHTIFNACCDGCINKGRTLDIKYRE